MGTGGLGAGQAEERRQVMTFADLSLKLAELWDKLTHKPVEDLLMGVLWIALLPFVWYYTTAWLKAREEEKEHRKLKKTGREARSSHHVEY